ncbi:hypothetical protein ACFL2X_05780 [Candidatus Latescibacterota bacterium]
MLAVMIFSFLSFSPKVSAADISFRKPHRAFSPVIRESGNTGYVFPGVMRESEKSNSDSENSEVSSDPSVEPSTAMYHSMIFPGWGQKDNGKKKKAALFFVAEIVCIGGYLYVNNELKTGEYSDFERNNLRTDRNTFVLYWMISKVFGLLDAYVDAQLGNYDVENITPEELKKD